MLPNRSIRRDSFMLTTTKTSSVTSTFEKWFVTGWRPFVGWICSLGFCYEFVGRPIINGFLSMSPVGPVFPGIEVDTLTSLLFGLLGLGAFRTIEKLKGVAR